jgi:A/G-specific adenine glycosylase
LINACAAHKASTPDAFPVKAAKKARPTRTGTAWWIEAEGAVLTNIRPAKGLLGGMRALPSCDWRGGSAPPLAGDWQVLGVVRHGFTHFDLELAVQALILPSRPALAGDWLALSQVESAGMPTLFAKAARLGLAADDLRENKAA